ncbi:unnamed protein product [Rotaria sordida]|uniref:Uncharacterized protein n=1 Tax=Rotaria sordida TaxID=392033 RepID=A0A814BNB8_9BILA|nr:unnamed protein product [Rotaria sordida]CAF0901940.1 unnamed protein product [Rotaria sordida]CAF0929056.1 unnamed protein product [Rotaria sordida]CAF0954320.1 unnamed protein product [Rotaria sordida]CAF3718066.1 unnamed protein product [Rotaria sordida]
MFLIHSGLVKFEIRENNEVVTDINKKFKIKSKYDDVKIEDDFVLREFTIEQGQDVSFILALNIVVDEVAHN